MILKYLSPLLCLTFFCFNSNTYGQHTLIIHRDSTLNNYRFNKECIEFIKKIQPYFIKITVSEETLSLNEDGNSKMVSDTAQIAINRNATNKEELIIHELFHLYLKAMGFPTLGYSFPTKNMETQSNVDYLNWFDHLLWDKIEHYYFYPIMKKNLHLNPYSFLELQLKEVFSKNEIHGLADATKEVALAGYYLQVWVETNNKTLLLKFKQMLLDKYGGLGISYGEKLISLFKSQPISTNNDAISLFINCFNLIHKEMHLMIGSPTIKKVQHETYTHEYAAFPLSIID